MATARVVGTILIVLGIVALVWGGISWTREKTVVDRSSEASRSSPASCCWSCPRVAASDARRALATYCAARFARPLRSTYF
jgi:hypothetical protein